LQPDLGSAPTLPELGSVWSQLATFGRPGIAGFLEQLCLCLRQGEVQTAEQLIAILDRALAEVARSLVPNTLRIATRTDQGPSRQRNEDACYPLSGNTITKPPEEAEPLAIVCDGIGGHEGGNVASNLAIETIQQQVQQLLLDDACLDATTISSELESSVRAANDRLSQRNDNEHRHGRQRMGTTLVMALARAHEIYIAHVGDSRAYWITRTGCHQVTLDDDVASREVRLGYALYRDALQQASSGSLVQALGMSSSASLYPTVQRFVLDEDCVFLLCTDGLSDYDRVEQCWETEILPILDGKVDVATAGTRLVEIANTQNGHDNVTVGLVYCQVSSCDPASTLSPSLADLATVSSTSSSPAAATVLQDANTREPANAASSTLNTHLLPSQGARRRFFVPLLLGLVLLLSLGGGLLAYLSKQEKLPRLVSAGSSPIDMQSPGSSTSKAAQTPVPNSASAIALQVGTLIQLKSPIQLDQTEKRPNQPSATSTKQPFTLKGSVPADSILKVVEIQENQEQGVLLKLEIICLTPGTGNSDTVRNAQPGQNNTPVSPSKVGPSPASSAPELAIANSHPLQGVGELLILENTLLPKVLKTLKPAQVSECSASTTPDAPAKQVS
jgi:protein phosphatase